MKQKGYKRPPPICSLRHTDVKVEAKIELTSIDEKDEGRGVPL